MEEREEKMHAPSKGNNVRTERNLECFLNHTK